MRRWIKIRNQYPHTGEKVLVSYRNAHCSGVTVAMMDWEKTFHQIGGENLNKDEIVAWMPFPKEYDEKDDINVTCVGISDEMLQEMTPWVAIVALKKAINNNAEALSKLSKEVETLQKER